MPNTVEDEKSQLQAVKSQKSLEAGWPTFFKYLSLLILVLAIIGVISSEISQKVSVVESVFMAMLTILFGLAGLVWKFFTENPYGITIGIGVFIYIFLSGLIRDAVKEAIIEAREEIKELEEIEEDI